MALEKFGFIVVGDEFEQLQGTDSFQMTVVGIRKPKEAIDVAKKMVEDGIQIIELCGAFGPVWTARVIEATEGKVPVGTVTYGPESMPGLFKVLSS